MNDNAIVGNITIDKTTELKNTLVLARSDIITSNWTVAKGKVDQVLQIDIEVPDAWFMRALLLKVAGIQQGYMDAIRTGRSYGDKSLGVFTESDIEEYYGHAVRFSIEQSNMYPNSTFVILVDDAEYKFANSTTIGIKSGTHSITCYALTTNGKTSPRVTKTFNITQDCRFKIKIGFFGNTVLEKA